jgi:ABC-type branched-subunit amino acid transport system ATPase component/ABC-type branched-subunit amino acid transport system permease subunit
LVLWVVGAALLPHGLPVGVVLLGLVLGSLTSLSALGIVLIYRASRVVNFAQAEIGGLAASAAVVLVTGSHVPYVLAVPIGLTVAVATGWLIDAIVVRRFFNAPRLIFTVATIGLAQILGAAEIAMPTLFSHLRPLSTFTTPWSLRFRVGPLIFTGDHVVALVAVPVVLAGLWWFLSRSDVGIAIQGAADSQERALLLGIPVRTLSRITWMVAAGLSGLAALLSAPIIGPNLGAVSGPAAILAPLTAAVVARLDDFPLCILAALGLGVFEQGVLWNYPRSTTVDLGLFAIILAALLLQRKRYTRVDDSGLGAYAATAEIRPTPGSLRRLPEVRIGGAVLALLVGAVVIGVPLVLSESTLILWAFFAIYGVIAVSLVVLTGWAGQISLGQFAFAGVGAAATAALLVHDHTDLFIALLAAAIAGALTAVLIGIPALRIPGLMLAVATLAFGVPVSTWLLNYANFPTLTPSIIVRPILFERYDLHGGLVFYYLCLAALGLAVLTAWNFRRSRAGRAVIAVRENERAAASYSIDPIRQKLTAFAFAGALAGIAGGLYAVAIEGIPFGGFDPILSLLVFSMVVIGGAGSLLGAILGTIYFQVCQDYLHGALELLATGGGLLILLMFLPGGLGRVVYAVRDVALRWVATRRGLSVPSLAERPEEFADSRVSPPALDRPLITCHGVNASYGHIQVLFDVDVAVGEGEIVALLGTNGAGKSTVLRVMAGLLPAEGGSITFLDQEIGNLSPADRVKAGLVTVPGGRGVFGSLSVADNLRLGGWLVRKDRTFVAETTERIFSLFPRLAERRDSCASLLSGGEQQMLTIAMALLCRPRLLMIDELSLGLAPTVVASLLEVVRDLNRQGVTILVVEQSVNIATDLAERAVFMEKGQVRFSGPTAALADRSDIVRSVFLRSASSSVSAAPRRSPRVTELGVAALDVVGLSRAFGGITAVDGVDLSVPPGEILGVIGPNGSGKTTLLDLCSGFLPADRGAVHLAGRDVTGLSASRRAAAGLGRLFQDARLFPALTVRETIAVALERHIDVRDPLACIARLGAVIDSERAVRSRVDELIQTMGLDRYADAFVSELSTGTRRIVDLACAIAHDPRVLLLDEPSSGIAQRESEALGELLLSLRASTGAAFVLIEHDIPLVTSLSDRMICLHLGSVIAEGAPADVMAHPDVITSYLGDSAVAINRSGRAKRPARRQKETFVDA